MIKRLELGSYKNLNIKQSELEVTDENVFSAVKKMCLEKMSESKRFKDIQFDELYPDDEIVKNLHIENVNTVKELEDKVSEQMYNENLINDVMRQVLDNVIIEYDKEAIEEAVEKMCKETKLNVEESDLNMDLYYAHYGIEDDEHLKELFIDEIKTSHLEAVTLEKIIEVENIEIENDVFEQFKKEYLIKYPERRHDFDEGDFKKSLLFKKTIDKLIEWNVKEI